MITLLVEKPGLAFAISLQMLCKSNPVPARRNKTERDLHEHSERNRDRPAAANTCALAFLARPESSTWLDEIAGYECEKLSIQRRSRTLIRTQRANLTVRYNQS